MVRKRFFDAIGVAERSVKPRESGLTILIDWGMGPEAQADCLLTAGDYIDMAKIAVGVTRLLPAEILRAKIELYEQHQVAVFPGGQFLEYATYHGQTEAYFEAAREAGYSWIEVSDNVIDISWQEKLRLIRTAREKYGLEVLGEVGSKVEGTPTSDLIEDIRRCLEAGARKVLVEAAELFAAELNESLIDEITAAVPLDSLVFEVPGPWNPGVRRCDQYATRAWLIRRLGPEVNLANVSPEDIMEAETMRRGIGVAALKWGD